MSLVTTIPTEVYNNIQQVMVSKDERRTLIKTSRGWIILAHHGPSWVWAEDGWLITLHKTRNYQNEAKAFDKLEDAYAFALTLPTIKSTLPAIG